MVSKKDCYGYELVETVREVVDVHEGTIYPLLKRLTNDGYFETHLVESTEGPIRKYYHLTVLGEKRMETLLKEWNSFVGGVQKYIKECK